MKNVLNVSLAVSLFMAMILEAAADTLVYIIPPFCWIATSFYIKWNKDINNHQMHLHVAVLAMLVVNVIESILNPDSPFTQINGSFFGILMSYLAASFFIYKMVFKVTGLDKNMRLIEVLQAVAFASIPILFIIQNIFEAEISVETKYALIGYHMIDFTFLAGSVMLLRNTSKNSKWAGYLGLSGISAVLLSLLTSWNIAAEASYNTNIVVILMYVFYGWTVLSDSYTEVMDEKEIQTTNVNIAATSYLILIPLSVLIVDGLLQSMYHVLSVFGFLLMILKINETLRIRKAEQKIHNSINSFMKESQIVNDNHELWNLACATVESSLNYTRNTNEQEKMLDANEFFASFNYTGTSITDYQKVALSTIAKIVETTYCNIEAKSLQRKEKDQIKWNLLTQNSSEVVFLTDTNGIVIDSSPQCENYFKSNMHDVNILSFFNVSTETVDSVETLIDETYWNVKVISLDNSDVFDGAEIMVWAGDITSEVQAERFDHVTGLANTTEFTKTNLESYKTFAMINIRGFRSVNDSYGYETGDMVMNIIKNRIIGCINIEDKLFRTHGDEFIILTNNNLDIEQLETKMETIFDSVFTLNNHQTLQLSGYASLVDLTSVDLDHNKVLRSADTAIGVAKKTELGIVQYDENMQTKARTVLEMQNRLLNSVNDLDAAGFRVHFQPIVTTETENIYSVETLTRWKDESGNTVAFPDEFIPMAENLGVIQFIDEWMVRKGLAFVQKARSFTPDLKLQVNISPVGLTPERLNKVRSLVKSLTDDPSIIIIELIESKSDFKPLIPVLETMRKEGFGISIDDYGTGESNLQRVLEFPATQIKFAGELIEGAFRNPEAMRLQIESMAAKGCETIVEKVETQNELDVFTDVGIDHVQGWLFARDMDENTCYEWLQERNEQNTDNVVYLEAA